MSEPIRVTAENAADLAKKAHCRKCNRDLPRSAFYVTATGRLSRPCKDCATRYARERRADPMANWVIRESARRRYKPRSRPDHEARFWAKVGNRGGNGCWLWNGTMTSEGYGYFYYPKAPRRCLAHRFSYFLAEGSMPAANVLHRCDTPRCVRPDHLFLGTHQDNMADMVAKGRARGVRGETNHKAKVTAEQVLRLRARFAAGGITKAALARQAGLSETGLRHILNGTNWAHVPATGDAS